MEGLHSQLHWQAYPLTYMLVDDQPSIKHFHLSNEES